ncbi:hypothetical protein ACIO8G_36510 [Streptomyces sp. NPDC087219]|uniref:hypothetical protein n=1 Tax=Streptomyces sp. NPDC087219 TaxID=3365770 RepID=UPI003800E159
MARPTPAAADSADSGDTETQYVDKARIDVHFARMAAYGVDVARVRVFGRERRHGFEECEGGFEEQQYAAFDYNVESARTHGSAASFRSDASDLREPARWTAVLARVS